MGYEYDLVIRNGRVIDGTGQPESRADVGIRNGRIVAVGTVAGRGTEELDASGKLVTPGFVDIHTHYDGQATWESLTEPSSSHGVTTVVTGNCGVGFAPCRPADRNRLVALMEGVEDIPEAVMTAGLKWEWESFPEFLDVVERQQRDIDLAAMLPHACVRIFVMGDRAVEREQATDDDLVRMSRIAEEAMRAGAIGFGTSRSLSHKDSRGNQIPTLCAAEAELMAFANGMQSAGHGVIEALFEFGDMEQEFGLLRRVAEKTGRPVSFTLAQTLDQPHGWKAGLPLLRKAHEDGLRIKGQVIGRPTGLMLGFSVSYNPFSRRASYQALDRLPFADKVRELRKPEVRARILADQDGTAKYQALTFLTWYDRMFVLGDPPSYNQPLDRSIAALAARGGVSAETFVYDAMMQDDGNAIIFLALGNYVDGTLGAVSEMLNDDNTILGLGDGGAHYGLVCDAGYPTFMLSFWGRDVAEDKRITLPALVKKLAADTAAAVDLLDRGVIRPGYKADLNVIDLQKLRLHTPRAAYDLPGKGRRLKQRADGYVATIVNGEIVYRDGIHTGRLPGKLVRGPQPALQRWTGPVS
jgi:N-acyl-D-aspartate/D-glutamate deacylase